MRAQGMIYAHVATCACQRRAVTVERSSDPHGRLSKEDRSCYVLPVEFEWNPEKAAKNFRKHRHLPLKCSTGRLQQSLSRQDTKHADKSRNPPFVPLWQRGKEGDLRNLGALCASARGTVFPTSYSSRNLKYVWLGFHSTKLRRFSAIHWVVLWLTQTTRWQRTDTSQLACPVVVVS